LRGGNESDDRQSLPGSHDGFREELKPSYEIAIKKLSTASQETQP
jgi:hypothetical protein